MGGRRCLSLLLNEGSMSLPWSFASTSIKKPACTCVPVCTDIYRSFIALFSLVTSLQCGPPTAVSLCVDGISLYPCLRGLRLLSWLFGGFLLVWRIWLFGEVGTCLWESLCKGSRVCAVGSGCPRTQTAPAVCWRGAHPGTGFCLPWHTDPVPDLKFKVGP